MVGSHKRLFAKLEGRKLRSVIIRNEGKTTKIVFSSARVESAEGKDCKVSKVKER
jgi:hypothetical protein